MEAGQKVKLSFGGGMIGVVTAKIDEYQVSYSLDGKPCVGRFTRVELEKTDEGPEPPPFKGFESRRVVDDVDDDD